MVDIHHAIQPILYLDKATSNFMRSMSSSPEYLQSKQVAEQNSNREQEAVSSEKEKQEDSNFLWELRKYVLLLATLAASVTYSAGLNPPGGFWPEPDNDDGVNLAGDPVLHQAVTYPRRYKVFFYCNATAFAASIITVNLLLVRSLSRRRWWLRALQAGMILNQFGLMGAYAAGSCREVAMSTYVVLALVAVASLFAVCTFFRTRDEGKQPVVPAPPETVERKYLLTFATLVATVTYQGGLSTPGGFLSHSLQGDDGALAGGDPSSSMLRGHHPGRFMAFFYFNTMAFVASLVVIMLLMSSRTVTRHGFQSCALWVCTGAALIGLTGAFSVGSSIRSVKTVIYVIALVAAVLLYIGLQVLVLLCKPPENWIYNVQGTLRECLKLDQAESQDHQDYCAISGPQEVGAKIRHRAFKIALTLDLLGLIGAYAAGSCRQVSKSVYISVLVIALFLYVGIHVMVFMLQAFPDQSVPKWLKKLFELPAKDEDEDMKWELEKRHKLLLLLAILAASITYQAGMSPPGGFWQENKTSHVVGNPVLNDNYRHRYSAFSYCNWAAFVASLAIIMLLVNRKLSTRGKQSYALRVCVILDLIGLMGAFTAGSSRTYQAGLNPPGGVWQAEANDGLLHNRGAGDPIPRPHITAYPRTYLAFFYCNPTTFVVSLAILILLSNIFTTQGIKHCALRVVMVLDLLGLIGACADQSCRTSESDPAADEVDPSRRIKRNPCESTAWRVACAAAHHMTGNQSLLMAGSYSPVHDGSGEDDMFVVHPDNGGEVPLRVLGSGLVRTERIALDDVWYVPGLDSNLVSTGQLARQGCAITLGPGGCCITRGGALVGRARFTEGYQFELDFLKELVAPSM